jgi:hypothetical protein
MKRVSLVNGLSAVGGTLMLVAGLALIDGRVREQFGRLASGRAPSGDLADLGTRLQGLLEVAMQALRDQSMAHAPLVIFALAALVLVLFMTRT